MTVSDVASPFAPTTEHAAGAQLKLQKLQAALQRAIVGQTHLMQSLLVSLLCRGHVLIEGMPGLAKTTAAKTLATAVEADFHRIQFTPDLLPSDIIGTDIYLSDSQSFSFRKGPIFQNIVLADEINRAPAKVQSALLEAMQERQVTVGQRSYPLPELFMVLATQNPLEHEGTYPLPEAQLDRFLLHVWVDYPSHEEEFKILDLTARAQTTLAAAEQTSQTEILAAREAVEKIYVDEALKHYIISVVQATRQPELYHQELANCLEHGASPRASIATLQCAKATAWLAGHDYVLPEHIQSILPNVLRHRISLSYQAVADNISKETIIDQIIRAVALP